MSPPDLGSGTWAEGGDIHRGEEGLLGEEIVEQGHEDVGSDRVKFGTFVRHLVEMSQRQLGMGEAWVAGTFGSRWHLHESKVRLILLLESVQEAES